MHFQIVNDRLVIDGRAAKFVVSPNVGGRMEPTGIVLHDTADRLRPDDSINWFRDPASKVSAHVVIGRDGSITQMVDFDRVAWHAGKSIWKGVPNCNGRMIGAEIDNPGPLKKTPKGGLAWYGETFDVAQYGLVEIETKAHGRALWMPYTPQQLEAAERFVRALLIGYSTIVDVVGHYEISPGRKVDVGPQFPMAHFKAILGDRHAPEFKTVVAVQQRLADLGYFPGATDGVIGVRSRSSIRTFQEQNHLPVTGVANPATVAALHSEAAKEMPLAARAEATKADLKAEGSDTMSATSATKRGVEAGVVLQFADAVSQRQSFLEFLMSPAGFRFGLTVGVLGAIWFYADKIEWARLRDHVLGRNAGGPK